MGDFIKNLLRFISDHKRLLFLYIPLAAGVLVVLYVIIIFFSWIADKGSALEKLASYKQLIDRTEEMQEGMAFAALDYGLSDTVVDLPTTIYDRNGEIIGQYFIEKREIVPYTQIPDALVKSVIASEDRDFYSHRGVNPKGIFRAMVINIKSFRVVQGGSTITQQLAKVLFTDMQRSLKRKVYELFCAWEIENNYDKQDILSMYLNLIYFGNGAHGVEATSKMYFGKSVRQCSEVECAMIVATISSPRSYSPLSNLDNSLRKTRRILQSMVDAGFMKEKDADREFQKFVTQWGVSYEEDKAIASKIGTFIFSSYRINRAPFFNEYIRRILVDKFGEDALKKGGLSVITTIDGAYQDIAHEALKKGIDRQRAYHHKIAESLADAEKKNAELEKEKNIEGAFVSLNPATGEVYAWVGGSAFTTENQFDHVSQIYRQPGSSIKPLVYCAAIQDKTITAATLFADEATQFEGGYAPLNYSGEYEGPMIVREALRKSVNIVAVKVLEKEGYDTVFRYIQQGLDLDQSVMNRRFKRTLSFALGTYELSPMENAQLHSLLINGGQYIEPYGIRQVKDYNGNVIWDNEKEVQSRIGKCREKYGIIVDPIAGAITVSMLKGALQPGGTAYGMASSYGISFPAAGKTGTSTNYNDAWFVGYTSDTVSAVWIGNKKGAISLGRSRSGGAVSAPVWGEFASKIYRERKPLPFAVPKEGITYQTIDLATGKVPREIENAENVAVDELFYAGTEPGEYVSE